MLAEKGVLVSITNLYYKELRRQNTQQAKTMIREFTRHNAKLGIDYDAQSMQYVQHVTP